MLDFKQRSVCIFIFILLKFVLNNAENSKCGYASCELGDPDAINVHIIAHTHDDVGWLKSVDQYYYGAKNYIQHAGVQYILDNSIQQLLLDEKRRFIYVEMAFFQRWWREQSDEMKESVRTQLVANGRLQFILGGWSMADEATTHYTALIDEHTRGLRFLRENFGECGRPLVAWQIDPFGHSREVANLFSLMGYDSVFFFRLDYQEKSLRLAQQTAEMIWRGSDEPGNRGDLFTSLLYRDYCPPPGFCFDQGCNDDPIQDDPELFDRNVEHRVADFVAYVIDQARNYSSNHLLVTMGCDFQFENARMNFKNLDKLIFYVNQFFSNNKTGGPRLNLFYSTPTCYTYAVNQASLRYPVKRDDFLPYADKPHSFWSGFYVSRSALKGYERRINAELQATQLMAVVYTRGPTAAEPVRPVQFFDDVDQLRQTMGIMQHHDAVTGTEKQAVAYDYARRVAAASAASRRSLAEATNVLLFRRADALDWRVCDLVNISRCEPTELSDRRVIYLSVFNSLAWTVDSFVRFPIQCLASHLVDDKGLLRWSSDVENVAQLVPISQRTKDIPERQSQDRTGINCELVLKLSDLKPLELRLLELDLTRYYRPIESHGTTEYWRQPEDPATPTTDQLQGVVVLENSVIRFEFNTSQPTGGTIVGLLTNKASQLRTPLNISLGYYIGFKGNNRQPEDQSSGAYVFRPAADSRQPSGSERFSGPVRVVRTSGLAGSPNHVRDDADLLQEVEVAFETWATVVLRLYNDDSPNLEVEWTVGPLPDNDDLGREAVLSYATGLDSGEVFYTDANGRQLMQRVRNRRPSVPDWVQSEPVAGNYFPLNSRLLIVDQRAGAALAVLTDRSLGGASLGSGQLELMLHRATANDDSFGVGEALHELGADNRGLVVRGQQWVVLDSAARIGFQHRVAAQTRFRPPQVMFANSVGAAIGGAGNVQTGLRLRAALPWNVHLLTLDVWEDGQILLRLEHIFQSGEDAVYSAPAQVDLARLFADCQVVSAVEMNLAANVELGKLRRLVWQSTEEEIPVNKYRKSSFVRNLIVSLNPMEIRTFILRIA